MIAFAFAAPAPNDETIAADFSGDKNIKAEDLKDIFLKLKVLLLG
jgi:hypothetical protein